MTIHKALHPGYDINRMYVSRKESFSRIRQITATRKKKTDKASINEINKKQQQKKKIGRKQLYRHFKQQTSKISQDKKLDIATKEKS